jgi:hypothetical protein
VTTGDNSQHKRTDHKTYHRNENQNNHNGSTFCPPGQAKKGRC